MQASRTLILIGAWAAFFGSTTGDLLAQVTNTFKVIIPVKGKLVGQAPSNADVVPIGQIKAVVSLTADVAVTFRIKDENGTQRDFGPCGPSPALCAGTNPQTFTLINENNGAAGDSVRVVSPPTDTPAAAGDPVRYEIQFTLNSNHPDSDCHTTQNGQDSYQVQVISTTASIAGVCLESFDGRIRSTQQNLCTNTTFADNVVPLNNTLDPEATVDPNPLPTFACYKARPSVDVVMVLDKSGSMSIQDSGVGKTRMQALHDAVGTFLDTSASLSPQNDQVSIVAFATTATPATAFKDVTTQIGSIKNDVNLISAGGATSMGSGLVAADSMLTPSAGRRKVVLLMSDGQQNTDPMADFDGTGKVATYCSINTGPCGGGTAPTGKVALSHQVQFYPVTLGPSSGVPAAIDQKMANATHGFYLNTEASGNSLSMLEAFFVQLLQNFIRFNSYETVRLISASASQTKPFAAAITISTTSHDAVFSLMWPNQFGPLRLTVTPPGGALPIVKESASGLINLAESLPLVAPFDPRGDWKILVEAPTAVGVAVKTATGDVIPFNLHLMTDDPAIKSELSVVPGDYKAGDNIRLRAKLTRFGVPIVGLGMNPARRIKVDLIKPGQSIGDLLSDSTASATSSNQDIDSGAEAKLFNELQNKPLAQKQEPDIPLYDDGKPEHGDDVAGDGIYGALYPAILVGHYNFLFSVESTDPSSVRFSRQQLRTAYVRGVPDSGNTVVQTSVVRRDNGNVLSIVMTPRVKPGPGCIKKDPKCGRMGPGWANYFWFTTPGQTPFKAVDNLNGTYTATLAFTGSNPPHVSVHFENVLAVIGDSVTFDHLPQPLGPGTVIIADVVQKKCFGRSVSANVLLFFGAGAFLVGLAAYRPWRRRKQS